MSEWDLSNHLYFVSFPHKGELGPPHLSTTRDFLTKVDTRRDPSTCNPSKSSPKWETQMVEYEALRKNQAWELIPLPESKNIVGCKLVYKI